MKTQEQLLQGTGIPSDELQSIEFTSADEELLAVAEGVASIEFGRICDYLGIAATVENIPENYDSSLRLAGRWTLDYPTKQSLQA